MNTNKSKAAAVLGSITSESKATAARENGRSGGRPRQFNVRASVVRRFGADRPVVEKTVIPAVDGMGETSDEVTLQPGQWLEIIAHGAPDKWSRAVIRA